MSEARIARRKPGDTRLAGPDHGLSLFHAFCARGLPRSHPDKVMVREASSKSRATRRRPPQAASEIVAKHVKDAPPNPEVVLAAIVIVHDLLPSPILATNARRPDRPLDHVASVALIARRIIENGARLRPSLSSLVRTTWAFCRSRHQP